jgi:hypothetical protein
MPGTLPGFFFAYRILVPRSGVRNPGLQFSARLTLSRLSGLRRSQQNPVSQGILQGRRPDPALPRKTATQETSMYVTRSYENEPQPKKSLPSDRRSIKRRHLIYYLRVWDKDSGDRLGHLVDLNTSGLLVISEHAIPKDREYNLEMRWQDADEQNHQIQFRATSMWSRPDTNPAFMGTGFMLIDPTQEVLEPIQELIKQFGFQD